MAQLLTLDQASLELQVSRDTLKRLSARGEVKTVRLGRRIMIPASEVSRIVEEGAGGYASKKIRSVVGPRDLSGSGTATGGRAQ